MSTGGKAPHAQIARKTTWPSSTKGKGKGSSGGAGGVKAPKQLRTTEDAAKRAEYAVVLKPEQGSINLGGRPGKSPKDGQLGEHGGQQQQGLSGPSTSVPATLTAAKESTAETKAIEARRSTRRSTCRNTATWRGRSTCKRCGERGIR